MRRIFCNIKRPSSFEMCEWLEEHEKENWHCPKCTFGFPLRCACGSLIHNVFLKMYHVLEFGVPVSLTICAGCGRTNSEMWGRMVRVDGTSQEKRLVTKLLWMKVRMMEIIREFDRYLEAERQGQFAPEKIIAALSELVSEIEEFVGLHCW